jgi:hypothetical protein
MGQTSVGWTVAPKSIGDMIPTADTIPSAAISALIRVKALVMKSWFRKKHCRCRG